MSGKKSKWIYIALTFVVHARRSTHDPHSFTYKLTMPAFAS